MGQGLRRASWSEGGGCGGAAGFSFGERPGSNGGSAGRWLLPLPGNGPGAGGVLFCRREQAAAGRRASLSGRGRLGQKFPRGSGCCRSSETVREQAVCFLVEGDGLRRGASFSGRGGFGHVSRRHRYSLLSPAACVSAPRRLPPRCLSSSHHPLLPAPPPLLTRRTSCQPPRRLCPRRLCPRRLCPRRLLPPPPLLATPVAVCLPAACRFSPPVITRRLPFPPPCAGRADRWAAAAPRVVGRGAMRRRREVLRNNLENRKILPIFVSVKYRGSGLSRPGFLFFIGLSFLWQKRLSI